MDSEQGVGVGHPGRVPSLHGFVHQEVLLRQTVLVQSLHSPNQVENSVELLLLFIFHWADLYLVVLEDGFPSLFAQGFILLSDIQS